MPHFLDTARASLHCPRAVQPVEHQVDEAGPAMPPGARPGVLVLVEQPLDERTRRRGDVPCRSPPSRPSAATQASAAISASVVRPRSLRAASLTALLLGSTAPPSSPPTQRRAR